MKEKKDYKKIKKIRQRGEIDDVVDEINKILKRHKYEVMISEWLVFTNKNGSFSFETNKEGLLIVQN